MIDAHSSNLYYRVILVVSFFTSSGYSLVINSNDVLGNFNNFPGNYIFLSYSVSGMSNKSIWRCLYLNYILIKPVRLPAARGAFHLGFHAGQRLDGGELVVAAPCQETRAGVFCLVFCGALPLYSLCHVLFKET